MTEPAENGRYDTTENQRTCEAEETFEVQAAKKIFISALKHLL
jgi:hypothetical protein